MVSDVEIAADNPVVSDVDIAADNPMVSDVKIAAANVVVSDVDIAPENSVVSDVKIAAANVVVSDVKFAAEPSTCGLAVSDVETLVVATLVEVVASEIGPEISVAAANSAAVEGVADVVATLSDTPLLVSQSA